MVYDPASMKLLARGGQADIYELDSGRVLRVLRQSDERSAQMLQEERAVMALLRERGVGVPEVYGAGEAGGLPAFEMERISGPSMLELLARDPLGARGLARKLADLHAGFLIARAPEGLEALKERAQYLIGVATLLGEEDKAFARSLLDELPDGAALLHGDFHPGNILTRDGGYYIIDWFGATKGDPVSDAAHTYLLCADKPRVPGEGWAMHRLLKTFARSFGRMYLKDIRSNLGFGMDVFGKWLAVRSAERSVYGQPSERQGRAEFVGACRAARDKGVGSAAWHRLL
jgi:aminoglycoside phosphotransferase (APT) family kinase protein